MHVKLLKGEKENCMRARPHMHVFKIDMHETIGVWRLITMYITINRDIFISKYIFFNKILNDVFKYGINIFVDLISVYLSNDLFII